MKTHTGHFIPITIALGFSLSVMPFANAETTENLKPNRYIHQGEFTLAKLDEFKAYLEQYPTTSEIEFVNSMGASSYALELFEAYNQIIEQRKLVTYARGTCNSLCATLFLQGYGKYFLPAPDGGRTSLGMHPVFYGDMQISYQATLYIDKTLQRRNPWLNEKPFFKMYDVKGVGGSIIIYSQPKAGHYVYFRESYGSKLQVLSDHTLEQLGIGLRDE